MPLAPNPNPVVEVFGICEGCNTQIEAHEIIGCICRCGDLHDEDAHYQALIDAENNKVE